MEGGAGKPKIPEEKTQLERASRKLMCRRRERREADVCFSEERYSRWNSEGEGGGRRGATRLDFWCIGVLIPTLNYPLSWAQLGPLVKIPLLFVLRNR